MQKWEYSLVKCEQDRNDNWHPRFINGQERKHWENGPDIPAFLNQVGEEGWELIQVHIDTIPIGGILGSATAHAKETAYRLFFKRPK